VNMMRWTSVLLCISLVFAGCISKETVPELPEEQTESPVAVVFPAWIGVDHTNTSRSLNHFDNMSYLAYFSAPWCAHCESTLNAYDLVVPEERLVVFSRESREEYANMSEWHNTTEQNLNRTFNRPFILHPDLAMEVEAKSIPHAVFVNQQGYVYHVEIGKETNQTYIADLWNAVSSATFSPETGWNTTAAA
jgi:thiol-disulfide isomerase/thioredoxin